MLDDKIRLKILRFLQQRNKRDHYTILPAPLGIEPNMKLI